MGACLGSPIFRSPAPHLCLPPARPLDLCGHIRPEAIPEKVLECPSPDMPLLGYPPPRAVACSWAKPHKLQGRIVEGSAHGPGEEPHVILCVQMAAAREGIQPCQGSSWISQTFDPEGRHRGSRLVAARSRAWVCVRVLLLCLGLVCLGPWLPAAFPTPKAAFLSAALAPLGPAPGLWDRRGFGYAPTLLPGTVWTPERARPS